MGDGLFLLIMNFLKENNYIVNFDELNLQLLSHPSYPSLHSVTGILNHFNIENLALQVSVDEETLEQLPENFISITSDNNQYVLVFNNRNNVVIQYGDKKKKTVSKNDFLQIWSGIIVVIDSIEKNGIKKVEDINSVSLILSGLFLTFLCIVFVFSNPTLFEYQHFILSFIGLGFSFFILKLELGYQSKLTDKFCNSNKLTSCDAVLNSNGASFLKFLKMSDLSIIYFSALIISWIVHTFLNEVYSSMIVISSVAVLITFYTLYYQYKIVKKWCPLCLGVTSVLWLQLLSIFIFNDTPLNPYNFKSASILLFSLLTTTSLWVFIKPLLEKQQELKRLKMEYYKFKKNFDLFYALYDKSDFFDTENINNQEILLGNENAALQILIVTNPSCFYCKSAHSDLEKLLERNGDKINLTIRFNVPGDMDNPAHKTANRLLQLYHSGNSSIKRALSEAYEENVNLDEWLQKWKISDSNYSYEQVLIKEKQWCKENSVHFTPALFINGKQYPKMYDRKDLQYFVEDLIELQETSSSKVEII